ncbi:unnamed protein product [Adineta steineri]|uniref:ABM domain-containing protein n=1 Tax=Adineta steineri TaxID=433720 RepID=A0A819J9F9_9BILA|nr:unnamed protein product [Adineta steineri]
MSTSSTTPILEVPQTSAGRFVIIATIKAKDEASATRLESLIVACRDFSLSSAAPTCHTYRTVRSLDKKNGVVTFVIFEEWDTTPDTLQTYFESDAIQEWNKALKEENLLAEPWEEPPPFYEEFIRK